MELVESLRDLAAEQGERWRARDVDVALHWLFGFGFGLVVEGARVCEGFSAVSFLEVAEDPGSFVSFGGEDLLVPGSARASRPWIVSEALHLGPRPLIVTRSRRANHPAEMRRE